MTRTIDERPESDTPESDTPDRPADDADAIVDDIEVVDGPVRDPRLRDRWVATRRAAGRRRLWVLAVAVGLLTVGALAVAVARSSLLGMDSIEVRGAAETPAAAVRLASGIDRGEPLLFLDAAAVARRVERLPWVRDAEVSTRLPGTVEIRVRERTPIAWADAAGAVAVLDRDGRVLTVGTPAPPGVAEVAGVGPVGPPGSSVGDPSWFRALGRFPLALRLLAERVEMRGPDAVVVLRGTGAAASIRLGPLVEVPEKVEAAMAVYRDLVDRGERVSVIDVRVPSAPVTR
jgi:cell division septal protein FtsQ